VPDTVDYGLDAVMCRRYGYINSPVYFSTEILYNEEPPFTDGDLLLMNNGMIAILNELLISNFDPGVKFLGLDAITYWER
jgi:hypothetical protein